MEIAVVRMEGFTPIEWPVVSLPRVGRNSKKNINGSNRLLGLVKQGYPVLFVGNYAAKDDHYKLLGLAYCKEQIVNTVDFLTEEKSNEERYNRKGQFQYPIGLPIRKAYLFKEPLPDGIELLSKSWMDGIPRTGFRSLKDAHLIETIINLKHKPPLFPKGKGKIDWNKTNQDGSYKLVDKKKTKKGPRWVYVFRYNKTECWKIGYTNDLIRRQKELAAHVPKEITRKQWSEKPTFEKKFPNKSLAYAFEQLFLSEMKNHRIKGTERVICPKHILESKFNSLSSEYDNETS